MTPSQKQAIEDKADRLGLFESDKDIFPTSLWTMRNKFIEGATFGLSLQTNEWVSVTPETMPPERTIVLLYFPLYKNMCTGYLKDGVILRDSNSIIGECTHWGKIVLPTTK